MRLGRAHAGLTLIFHLLVSRTATNGFRFPIIIGYFLTLMKLFVAVRLIKEVSP